LLKIEKNGRLLRTNDEIGAEPEEVYSLAPCLMEETVLADDLVLRDIFLLVHKNMDFCADALGRWTEEITLEGLKKTRKKKKAEPYSDASIEYLEVYWEIEASTFHQESSISGLFPEFGGRGSWYRKIGAKKHKKQYGGICISLTPANQLAPYPLKLNRTVSVYRTNYDKLEFLQEPLFTGVGSVTLLQILYAIYWELSFYGSPRQRRYKLRSLKKTLDGIKTEADQ
jgi:hypothetical protein